jgi:hypothetical protein
MTLIDMKAASQPQLRSNADALVKIDLDERAYLFPEGKQLLQLHVIAYRGHKIRFEAVYAFNESRASPELFELPLDDAVLLLRRLVETVYRAQSSQIVTRSTSLAVTVVANGYLLQFGGLENSMELMLSTGCIWRVCGGLARALDTIAPSSSN